MRGTTLPKLVAATALAVSALGAAPLAQAGTGTHQKHPDRKSVQKPAIIGVLSQAEIIGVLKNVEIIGVLKHPAYITVRKAGG